MCRNEGIHTAIETNGNTDIEDIKILSELLDYVMIDLKHVDDKKHREYTYSDNKRNLEAIKYYTEHNITEVRIPVIPDFNDSAEEIQGMLDFRDIEENRLAKEYIDRKIEEQKINVNKAEANVERARRKMSEAMAEKKTYEKLRDKAFEEYLIEENRAESKVVDELTSYTYGQKAKA